MGKRSSILLLVVLLLVFLPRIVCGMEISLSMNLWNRYTAEFEDGDLTESMFSLERGYFRIEPKFSDRIKGRFNVDFFSDADGPDGAGLKLKYAYLDFNEVLPIPESKITAGLIKHYFGTIYDWEYVTIEKAFEDVEGVISSTDYGIGLYGYLPEGFGEYTVAVMNGEGYKKTGSDLNLNPEFLANLRFVPVPGITIGGSVLYENAAEVSDSSIKRLAYAGVGRFARGPIEIWGEYLMREYSDITSSGFMVMPVVKLKNIADIDVDLVGRYDMWDVNNDVDNDGHSRIIAGFNWHLQRDSSGNPMVFLQVQGERIIFEEDGRDTEDAIMVQLRWSFSNVIMD